MQAVTIAAIILQCMFLTLVSYCALYWLLRAGAAHLECKELDVVLKRRELSRIDEQSSGG